ncbi:type 1 pili tip component [Hahella sp. SMD15-11]|uniref:Type 1 pili tip component n=1 Tax=Thermohahella caldifontis TaxID=3142973 RepID=A0AB39V149_9GAMM
MNIKALAKTWEENASSRLTAREYKLRLPIEDAARVEALAEMYPRRSVEDILSELLTAALDELETSFPYVQGEKVVAVDEMGDPLYEDVGPTPRFLALSKKYAQMLKQELKAANT